MVPIFHPDTYTGGTILPIFGPSEGLRATGHLSGRKRFVHPGSGVAGRQAASEVLRTEAGALDPVPPHYRVAV